MNCDMNNHFKKLVKIFKHVDQFRKYMSCLQNTAQIHQKINQKVPIR